MYHKVSASTADALTVTPAQLEQQLRWLHEEQFVPVTVADVIASVHRGAALPRYSVLITFDDAYVDTLELAKPVLDRCGWRAAVFVPSAFIGEASSWDSDARPLMDASQLRQLSAAGWEIGLHSHRHANYANLATEEIAVDVRESLATLRAAGVTPVPALAYPYGRRPASRAPRAAMVGVLRNAGITVAFRIGNRINRVPLRDPFEINRLDVRGDRTFAAFQRKLRWGRLLG